jgi:hypothetical protein
MTVTDLMIGIGAEYKGKPAFAAASKQVTGLNKSVGLLAKRFITLYAAQKAYNYGKQSVKAFAEDDLAAQKLSKTLGNLGLAYESTNVESFIAQMERTFHVADDLLRPAFSKLISTTQSYTKSEELLRLALDASIGANVDLSTTINDLSQAYVGNLKGLKKYNLGLTNAELALLSFDQIQKLMTDRMKGQASQAADTFSSKMDALTIASGNAKEIIGKSLVQAMTDMAGKKGDIENLAQSIEDLATALSSLIAPISWLMKNSIAGALTNALGMVGSKEFKKSVSNIVKGNDNSLLELTYGKFDPLKNMPKQFSVKEVKAMAKRAAQDALALKRQKALASELKKQTAELAKQAALKKAQTILSKASDIFNPDLIQNMAALQGKITEDETLRLKLQQALLLENADAAAKLGQELLDSQLAALMVATVDPFGKYSDSAKAAIEAIKLVQSELAKLGTPTMNVAANLATSYGQVLGFDSFYTAENDKIMSEMDKWVSEDLATSMQQVLLDQILNVNIDAAPGFIADATIANTANGNSNQLSRVKSYAGGA